GNEVWTRNLGTLLLSADSIAVDATGIYVTGLISPMAGPGGFKTALNKYDFDGLMVWTKAVTSQSYAYRVAAGNSGVHVAATNHIANFIRKYDSGGSEVWTHTLIGDTSVTALALDGDDLFAAGITSLNLPGQCAAGGTDEFVSRYAADGTELWTRQL